MSSTRPSPETYWVTPQLLAGEYPGSYYLSDARQKVAKYLDAGITFFVDLTEEGELEPYDHLLSDNAHPNIEITHRRMSILDHHVPTRRAMTAILDTIDGAVAAGHKVYVHCWGGIGRTGTVVGCWLRECDHDPDSALERVQHLYSSHMAKAKSGRFPESPQIQTQKNYIRRWKAAQ